MRHFAKTLSLALAVSGLVGCSEPSTTTETPTPNIILITLDTLRADHLGCYGYFRDTTPNLDRFAEQSLVFDRAYAPMATTLPSHLTLLTGVYPLEHGVLANVKHGGLSFVPHEGLVSFAQVAVDNGYETAAFVSAAPLKRETGIDAGFEVFDQPQAKERSAGETNSRISSWIPHRDAPRKLFLWVHYFDPHNPYRAPEPYRGMYRVDSDLDAYVAARGIDDTVEWRGKVFDVRNEINEYDAEIRYMDDEFGRLLALLEGHGVLDDAFVIVAGDHGEGLGEHGEMRHGCIHDEQLRVPLMIRHPDASAMRIAAPVSLADVLVGISLQLGSERWSRFLEQASGLDPLGELPAARAVFSQRTSRDRNNIHPFAYVLTTSSYKLVHEPDGATRLFDLRVDPYERDDLLRRAGDVEEVSAPLLEELERTLARQRERGRVFLGEGAREQEMDPERLEELRSLGYVD